MNHYQKLATVLVRASGMAMGVLGLFGLVYGVVFLARGATFSLDQSQRFSAGFWWLGLGLILFLLGRPLGRLLGRKLE
jgi:hypothetical protein